MATTINSGRGSSPLLTADVASRAEVYGGRGIVFDGIADYLSLGDHSIFNHSGNYSISVWIKKIGQPSGNRDTNDNPTIIAKGNVYFTLFVNHDGMLGTFFYNNSDPASTDYNVKTADGVIKLNVWHHVVLTWNSTSSQLYVDGKQEYSGSSTPYNLNTGVNGKEIRIGDKETPSSDSRWHGNMSDMKIFDSHLTEAQVQELYLKPENTPSAVQSNLKAWYPMCEGLAQSVAYDHSGNNNHAVEGGGSSYALAVAQNEPLIPQIPLMKYNQKMIFDGVNDYVQLPIPLGTTKHAISIWYYAKNVDEYFFDSRESSTHGIVLGTLANGTLWYAVRGPGATSASLVTTSGSFNKWNHVVATYNGSTAHVYINGVDVTPVNNSWSCTIAPTSVNARLGSFSQSVGGLFDGGIDEASYFNTDFNQTEAQELYNSGVALDATTHSKSGNLLGYWRNDGISSWSDRRGWSYLDFDSTDYIDCGTAIGNSLGDNYSNDLTVSLWFKLASVGTSRGLFNIGAFDGSTGSLYLAYFNYGALAYRLKDGGVLWTKSVTGFTDLGWNHMAVVYDASSEANSKLYLNGSSVGGAGGSGTFPSSLDFNGLKTIIGAVESNSWNWEGGMKSVGLYNVAKSEAEIQAIYNAGINSSEVSNSGIINYWELDNASTVKDLVGSSNGTPSGTLVLNDGNDGTVAGTPNSITIREGLTSGKDGLNFPLKNPSGNVLRLNGVNEYVEINDSSVWDFNINDFSVSYWFKVKNIDWNWAIGRQNSSANEDVWRAGINNNGKIIFRDIAGSDDSVGSTTILVDTWYHFTAVRNNGTLKVYLNESEDGTVASSGNLDSDKPIKIGSSGHHTSDEWDGLLDEVRIYNRALSTTEISKNYKHQKGKHKND